MSASRTNTAPKRGALKWRPTELKLARQKRALRATVEALKDLIEHPPVLRVCAPRGSLGSLLDKADRAIERARKA